MSALFTQALIAEKYGLRLNTEQLAEVLWNCEVPTYVDMGVRFADYRAVAAAIERAMAAGRDMEWPRLSSSSAPRPTGLRDRRVAWADEGAIAELYAEARRLTEATGIKHAVDHVIPLKGRLVCGLHVETNMQILTKSENSRKRNRFEVA